MSLIGLLPAEGPRRSLVTSTSSPQRPVYVASHGVVPVTRNAGAKIADMGKQAIDDALKASVLNKESITAMYVGNMLSGILSNQQHVSPLIATAAGLNGIETSTIEACCGSGGAALRWGYMAIASGMHENVLVLGVEQMTHCDRDSVTKGLATASHWEKEGAVGETFVSLNGKLMSMYMKKYGIGRERFAPFSLNAHKNALTSSHSTLKKNVSVEDYTKSNVVKEPVTIMDASPTCDGAAAVLLTSNKEIAKDKAGRVVRLAGSGASSDILAVDDRPDPLALVAVEKSLEEALRRSGLDRNSVDIFELHDAYTIMACLCLESAGFASPGEGTFFAADGHIGLKGVLPISTFGGLKARGHPVGATGVYQAAEMNMQLREVAGENQVKGARVAVTQNIGGAGASVYTHVFIQE
ncbi:hypothetical protein GUITHDRAFT_70018 [Guillardia theta CCMP2712]|uniref:Thiolase N-terminal domain-containing protein n=2 Tax=Guillardia theta TaxID=55529 RepID=L1JF55_GUITC|nr:hypothetical protein GUITHDRAFT_70018 [Guillardia theta CCMP2712]EKX46932.1 hypothetical protein GUITHDRAFT_70018 [Guillardia theta CCMP2712]|eukprot:XP_005833912.1 hypothetical protein GUITHDRAFT_70018 [Guillardia theta CCMP2712]